MNRRSFLSTAAAAPAVVSARALGRNGAVAPSERVTLGVIGCGNQGTGDMMGFLEDKRVQIVAVCDVNRESAGYWGGAFAGREPARKIVEWTYAREKRSGVYKGCDAYSDFRKLIARKDVDALLIAVPDHWHSIPVIEAARAGKDVYGEKPLSLTIAEGRAMSDAVKKHGRVFQCGSQQRSDSRFRQACELVRNGRIGKLRRVHCGLPGGTPDFGRTGHRKESEPVPEGFDYNFWLGPAPDAPYCPARCHVNYRWVLDYSGGQITDWGGHHPDIAQWGMGTDETGPVEIRNGKAEWCQDKPWNTATHFYFDCVYENGVTLTVTDQPPGGVTFYGADGWVRVNRGWIDANPKSLLEAKIGPDEIHLYESRNHFANFIDCVLSRKEPIAPVETAHRSITIAHLGNISLRLGRDLKWDPKAERFTGDDEANKMLSRPMRHPWSI